MHILALFVRQYCPFPMIIQYNVTYYDKHAELTLYTFSLKNQVFSLSAHTQSMNIQEHGLFSAIKLEHIPFTMIYISTTKVHV